ncbi:MAG: hypothetical protein R3C11_09500 [Planctomycetaceae bacterium]
MSQPVPTFAIINNNDINDLEDKIDSQTLKSSQESLTLWKKHIQEIEEIVTP